MDVTSNSPPLDTRPHDTSLVTLLLELMLAFLFFITACISLVASTMIRLFHLRSPPFWANPHGRDSYNCWKQEKSCNLICDDHAYKLRLLKTLILKRGYAHIQSLCEDCILLKCSFIDTDNDVMKNGGWQLSTSKCSLSDILMQVGYCQVCWMKRHISSLRFSSNKENLLEALIRSLVEGESEFGSSGSFIGDTSERRRLYKLAFCVCCEGPIRHTSSRTGLVKDNSAKVVLEDFHKQGSVNNILQENLLAASSEREKYEILREGYGKEKKAQEFLMLKEDSNLDCRPLIQDCKSLQKMREALPQSCDLEGKHYTVKVPEEDLQHTLSMIKDLKYAVEAQRLSYSDLYAELEAERNASAVAAKETMAMISRLQEEKAAIQMEATQFKRIVEEKAAFDQEAISLLKEILCKREEEKLALEKEVEAYRSWFLNHRITEWRQKKAEFEDPSDEQRGLLTDWKQKIGKNLERRRLHALLTSQRTPSNLATTSCQQTLAVILPELLDMQDLPITQSTIMEDKGEPKMVPQDVPEYGTDTWSPACVTDLQQTQRVGGENVDKVQRLSEDFSRLNHNNDNNNTHRPYSYWNNQGQSELVNNVSDTEDFVKQQDRMKKGMTKMTRSTLLPCSEQNVGDVLPSESDDSLKYYKISPDFLEISKEHCSIRGSSQDVKLDFQGLDNELQAKISQGPEISWEVEQLKATARKMLCKQLDSSGATEKCIKDVLDPDAFFSVVDHLSECLSGCSGYDIQSTSMVRRDEQRLALLEEVEQLTSRLQVVEDDRHMMQNVMVKFGLNNKETGTLIVSSPVTIA